ncbi:MAG: hypothetical protein L0Z49_01120 [Actinobacteria bacterium]|nr:hypothetical protein [Actinomycetota bacterium]
MDRANQTGRISSPPRSGKGSTRAAWAIYATALGYSIPAGTSRKRIFELLDAGPPPKAANPRIPKVEGTIFEAVREAVDAAAHLTHMDRPAVEYLFDLAKILDGMDQRPPTTSVDVVTGPTFLRCLDALGLTPLSRTKLDLKAPEGPSKLAELRSIRTRTSAVG